MLFRSVQHDATGAPLTDVVGAELYGPSEVEVLTVQGRSDTEVLLVLRVAERTPTGMNDLHLFLRDGSDLWVNDAFVVVSRPSQAPTDYWPEPEPAEDTADTDR